MSSELIYLLKKDNQVVYKTSSKCSESAIEDFLYVFPQFLEDKSYRIEVEVVDFFNKILTKDKD
jgi:hypothetical protein